MKLLQLIQQLENKIADNDWSDANISNASVGWHIEHSLLAIDEIIKEMLVSDPKDYKWKFNIYRSYIFAINEIPRGKNKSPVSVQPKTSNSQTELLLHVILTKEYIDEISQMTPNHFFHHPHIGMLNVKPALKFIELHTKHHLKIVDDILL